MTNTNYCPRCMDGVVYGTCSACGGQGEVNGEECQPCGGGGEVVIEEKCSLCGGAGEVPISLMHLYEADRYASRNPEWTGDNETHPGVTVYSQAHYYRERGRLRGNVKAVHCHNTILTQEGIGFDINVVDLLSEKGFLLLRLTGFNWGYGGTGPCGFADVLADLFPDRFASDRDALDIIASHPMHEEWKFCAD